MRIAVVGGTGTLGRKVTAELDRRGHEVRVLSRSSPDFPVDLASGQGLASALAGCGAVIDASNTQRHARQVMVEGTGRLLTAEQLAGVGHHVCISIRTAGPQRARTRSHLAVGHRPVRGAAAGPAAGQHRAGAAHGGAHRR
jgi:nucleoside-diphosphate-sugar epimerase